MTPTHPFAGQGPGMQTEDGCSVELYRRLVDAGETELLAPQLRPGHSLLELGCGTGRQTRCLLDLGCAVTAVDSSEAMLAHVPEAAQRVCADILSLDLGPRFEAVLLPSGLINHHDAAVRAGFLASAARHLAPGGRFFLQRQDPHWLQTAEVGAIGQLQGLDMAVESVRRTDGLVTMTLSYACSDSGQRWTHAFTVIPLDEAALQAQLSAAGFGPLCWLDARRRWAKVKLIADAMDLQIRPLASDAGEEIEQVAQRMRATLIEVEGEAAGTALYSIDWLRDRVRFHLDPQRSEAQVLLATGPAREVIGHTIVRREAEPDRPAFGLFSTTYVAPEARRRGVAEALLQAGERWMQSRLLTRAVTWTSSTNQPLIRLYVRHGYRQTATNPHQTTGTLMVRLERCWDGDGSP